jgi:hypothetical protein
MVLSSSAALCHYSITASREQQPLRDRLVRGGRQAATALPGGRRLGVSQPIELKRREMPIVEKG